MIIQQRRESETLEKEERERAEGGEEVRKISQ